MFGGFQNGLQRSGIPSPIKESLVLFILPAFMLCILFTNIEPRMMMVIFERNQMGSERGWCSLYSLISYGSTIMIYPILMVTNLNSYLFLALSCMLFPQIYLNAVRGHRPDYTSEYYTKFIFSRFILVVNMRLCRFTWGVFLIMCSTFNLTTGSPLHAFCCFAFR